MGDLASDSERVPMEGHDSSFICEDDKVLLEEALPPAGQTLCSCGELHHSQDGTHEQCMNGDSVENEVDISGSRSSGIKRGKGSGGNSQGFSECSEPKVKKIYNKSRKTSHPSSAPESLMSDARASGRRPLVPSVACEVKQFNWLQRNIMCMGVDTHKGQYEAYRQLHDMAHAQQLVSVVVFARGIPLRREPSIHRPQISPTRNFLRPTASPSPQRPCRPSGGGGGSSGPRAGHDAAGAGRRTLRRRPRPLRLLLPPPQAFSPSLPLASPALLLLVLLNPFPETSPSPPRPHSSLHRCQCGGDFSIARVLLRGPDLLIRGFIDWRLIPLSSVASDFMGDLACDSERVPMEGHDSSFICEDDKVLLEVPLTPAGQTLCSCGELHHSQDGTHEQCMNGDSVENEVDISGSRNSGIKRGKGSGGNSQGVSECSEPKESSTCERSPSFLSSVKLVSAMKGGRERSGEGSPTEVRRVKWAPDVYDPPVTSVDHSVKSLQQRPRSRKKEKNKQKHKKKRKSRGNGKNSGVHDSVHIPPALEVPRPSSPDDCDLEPEVLDYDTGGGQEAGQAMLDEATSSRQGPF